MYPEKYSGFDQYADKVTCVKRKLMFEGFLWADQQRDMVRSLRQFPVVNAERWEPMNHSVLLKTRDKTLKQKVKNLKTTCHTQKAYTETCTLRIQEDSINYLIRKPNSKLHFTGGNRGRELVIYIFYISPCCKGKIKPRCNNLAAAICRVPRKRALKRGLII